MRSRVRSRSARRHAANSDLIDRLMAAIQELEGQGVRVQFWLVPKFKNEKACRLAREALANSKRDTSKMAASGRAGSKEPDSKVYGNGEHAEHQRQGDCCSEKQRRS